MGEKGSLKNKIKDFFKIQKKLKKKKKVEQEEKILKETEKRKKKKAKLLMIIGYLGSIITFPLTQKKKNYKTTNPQKNNFIYNKNDNEKFQKTNSNYNKINSLKPEKINMLKENKEIKQKQTNFIIKLNNTSLQKIKKNINCNSYLNQQSISKQPTLKKSQTKKNDSMNQKLIKNKEKEKNKYVANAIVAGALASHFIGKVSKEILDATSSIFTDIPKDDIIDQHPNLKKENNMIDNSFPNNFIEPIDNNLKKDRPIYPEINDNVDVSTKHNEDNIKQFNQSINIIKENNIKNTSKEKINANKNTISKEKIQHDEYNSSKQKLSENFKLATIDIKNAFEIINNDILKQERELEQINQSLNQKEQKISIIKEKTSSILNPIFSFFQNTIFGKLIQSVIINHRIKYMRKIANQQYSIKYYDLKNILENINSQKEMIIKNIKINNNSLEEIESLKIELLNLNINSLEVMKTIQNLISLENNIIKQNNKLKKQIEKAEELEEKGKIKIKKLKAN